jgi:hypothetical protein
LATFVADARNGGALAAPSGGLARAGTHGALGLAVPAPPSPRPRLWIDALVLVMLAVALALSFAPGPARGGRGPRERRLAERPSAARLR